MKHAILIASAAAFAFATPAFADPGHGRGHGHDRGDRYHERDGDRYHRSAWSNDRGRCPPGLARKHNGCLPPGHARRLDRGQRWQNTYGDYYSYNRIPYSVRQQYDLNSRYRYYYNDGYLYQVDPRTQLVQQVINSILR